MFRKHLFILIHQLYDKRFYKLYKEFCHNPNKPYEEQKLEQEVQLRKLINHAYNNVPYYRNLFTILNLKPDDIKHTEDLNKLPILTKEIIKNNWDDFIPANIEKIKHYTIATGGSTGTPFKYRVSKEHRTRSGALLYKDWGYAGYELGDKVFFLAGASLNAGSKYGWLTKIHEFTRNTRFFSSFDMNDRYLDNLAMIINNEKPKFIRGYPSAIGFFAEYIIKNTIEITAPIKAVFTTSELLQPSYRKSIEIAFNAKVYDGYGLNDGGVTAFECSSHSGLHIDTDNAILEVIDNHGPILNGTGEIIATSLYNFALPFIRYKTGDYAEVTSETCTCGKQSKIIKKIIGREVDILKTPDGNSIHGWFFLFIFWKYGDGFTQYQVIQEDINYILIKYIKNDSFNESVIIKIQEVVKLRVPDWILKFEEVDVIEKTKNGKMKFIINKLIKD